MSVALGKIQQNTRNVVRGLRALMNSGAEKQAVRLAAGLPQSSIRIEDNMGCLAFDTKALGLGAEIESISSLAKTWQVDPQRSDADKPFLRNILRSQDIFDHPEILRVATHDVFFSAVSRYLGQVPWLVNLHIWWTPPNQTAVRSQLFHYDHRDTRQAKIFINLNDVDDEAGPLHFLSAASSEKVNRKIGYSQEDYTDAEVEGCVENGEILKATGPKGSGYIVDTARCLHYGSRGNKKDRLILMISYARMNCVSKGSGCEVLDPIRGKINDSFFKDDTARRFANQKQ